MEHSNQNKRGSCFNSEKASGHNVTLAHAIRRKGQRKQLAFTPNPAPAEDSLVAAYRVISALKVRARLKLATVLFSLDHHGNGGKAYTAPRAKTCTS